jgi:hypothetical protein
MVAALFSFLVAFLLPVLLLSLHFLPSFFTIDAHLLNFPFCFRVDIPSVVAALFSFLVAFLLPVLLLSLLYCKIFKEVQYIYCYHTLDTGH